MEIDAPFFKELLDRAKLRLDAGDRELMRRELQDTFQEFCNAFHGIATGKNPNLDSENSIPLREDSNPEKMETSFFLSQVINFEGNFVKVPPFWDGETT